MMHSQFLNSKYLFVAIYLLTIALGVVAIIWPPFRIENTLGTSITVIYGVLLLLGAAGSLLGAFRPNYKVEMNSLWGVVAGYGIHSLALWSVAINRLVVYSDRATPYALALAVTALTLFFCIRLLRIYQKSEELVKASDNDGLD